MMTKTKRAQNDKEIRDALDRFTNLAPLYDLAVSRIRWKPYKTEKIPDSINLRFLERTLCNEGDIIVFNDDATGTPLCLPCSGVGPRNVYGIPSSYQVWGYNGYHASVPADRCVRLLNNASHTPSFPVIKKFAEMLTNIDGMVSANIEASKHPFIIQCSEEQRTSLMKLINDIASNVPYIVADANLDDQAIKVLPTGVTFTGESSLLVRNKILNLCLSILGYENSNTDKKERLVASEVSSNYGLIEGVRNSMLAPRRKEEEMLEKLGWAMTPEWNSDVPSLVNRPELTIQNEGGANNETV